MNRIQFPLEYKLTKQTLSSELAGPGLSSLYLFLQIFLFSLVCLLHTLLVFIHFSILICLLMADSLRLFVCLSVCLFVYFFCLSIRLSVPPSVSFVCKHFTSIYRFTKTLKNRSGSEQLPLTLSLRPEVLGFNPVSKIFTLM